MRRRLPDVSTTQLVASGLATLAAAIGASYLGVYGTIIGAAFMSVASTAGAAVCKHYLDQGKKQIRERGHLQSAVHDTEVARDAAARATSSDPTRTVAWPAGAAGAGTGTAGARNAGPGTAVSGPAGGGDPNATRFDLPLPGGGGPHAARADPNATRMDPSATRMDPSATRMDPSATRMDPSATRLDRSPAEVVAEAMAEGTDDRAMRNAAWRDALRSTLEWAKQHWAKLAVSSAAVFAIVIGGITVYEATTGSPIGKSNDEGTSVRSIFGGGGGGGGGPSERAPTDAPTTRPAGPGETPSGPGDGGQSGGPSTPSTGVPGGGSTGAPTTPPTTEPTAPPTTTAPTTPTPTPAPSSSGGGPGGPGDGQQGGGDGPGTEPRN